MTQGTVAVSGDSTLLRSVRQELRQRALFARVLRLTGVIAPMAVLATCRPEVPKDPGGAAAEIDHSALSVDTVHATVLSRAPAMGAPFAVTMSGNKLWMIDIRGNPTLHEFDTTGTLLRSLGGRGEGPGEFAFGADNIAADPSAPGALWAFDMSLQRVTRFPADLSLADQRLVLHRLDGSPHVQRLVWVGGGRMIGITGSGSARFAIFAADGHRLRNAPGPLLGDPDRIPLQQRIKASNSGIGVCSRPGGHGFVIVYVSAGRIETYDRNARFERLMDVPFPSDPMFKEVRPDSIVHVRARKWYIGCSDTPAHLYALFSGRRLTAFEDEERSSGTYVHVFDWDGSLDRVLWLDHPVSGIAIDSAEHVMYAVSLVDATLMRFDLDTP